MTAERAAVTGRGQPLWALGGLLLCWIGMRAALIELPPAPKPAAIENLRKIVGLPGSPSPPPRIADEGILPARAAWRHALARPVETMRPATFEQGPILLMPPAALPPRQADGSSAARRTAGHNLLWMAAMGAIPLLPEVVAALERPRSERSPTSSPLPIGHARPSRWSGDAWLAWRSGMAPLGAPGAITPVFGGSQAGAVLRYDLVPRSVHRVSAYVRAVRALSGSQDGDIAAGIAVRPLPRLPVTAHGEARLSHSVAGLTLRPAAFVSGGVEDTPIAAGITARGYAQTGYVGGRGATAFADGSLIAEKPLWRERDTLLTAGAGAWGGAQRGAARLDIGPAASLRFRIGEGAARLSADYRLRIAGNAAPGDGAALTLSAGF